ncbi:T9SS type A sorting domain-containing protein [candidate division WOR-3 bacterium]|nr:T9SS type A sorting domain-containing protein [candidate division WOR-3 bacterium]
MWIVFMLILLGPWYKIELQEEGIYKIEPSQISASGVNPTTIKLYNGGSKMVTDSLDILKEVPIYVLPDTSVLFYGASLAGWGKNGEAFLNPYTSTNVYWLTYGGATGRRDSISGSSTQPTLPYFLDTLHIEEDSSCPAKSGLGWVWEKLERPLASNSLKKDYIFDVLRVYMDSCKVRFAVYGWYNNTASYYEESQNMIHNIRLYLNEVVFFDTSWVGGNQYPRIFEVNATGLNNGTNTLTIELDKGASTGRDIIFFDWFEVTYKKKYEAYNGNLRFSGELTDQKFKLQEFDTLPVIFNITDPIEPKRIYGAQFESDTVKFEGAGGIYYASTSFKAPVIKEESPYNLRETAQDLDFIIIIHPDFLSCANKLEIYREGQGLKTGVFSIFDIYNNFSWGLENSPYAIRNFLTYAYDNWGELQYCLLLGAGTYDYRNSLPKNRVPPHEKGYRVGEYGNLPASDCYDWWYANRNFAIGRITAKSIDEANSAIDKIINYEKNKGVWQNRILLIADDENPMDGCMFVNYTEALAAQIPPEFDIFKVYLMNYPLEGGITARADLIRYWNKGMFLVFFGGHGNLGQFCHERVFTREDIDSLHNGLKLPFSHFLSCGVGYFDRQYDESIADILQKRDNKGSIGTIAPTRATAGSGGLPDRIINNFLQTPLQTIGEGIYGPSMDLSLFANQTLFADPATKLPRRTIEVTIDSFPDTLIGGKPLKVCGYAPGANLAYITVRSSEYTYHYAPANCEYKMRGRMVNDQLCEDILFQGITEVVSGNWSQEFFIPVLDSIGDSLICGEHGKISVFAVNDSCGSAAIDTLIIVPGGGNPADTVGPTIELFVNGNPLDSGDTVPSVVTLSGILEDESGIDIFHKLEPLNLAFLLRVNPGDSIFLADFFQYDTGSCQRGSFSYYPLSLGPDGTQDTLYVQTSDNLGNRTEVSVFVVVGVEETGDSIKGFKLFQNYPNPFVKSTSIKYQLPVKSKVSLKIYNVAGRLVKTLVNEKKGPGYYATNWDAKEFSSGIYFVRFTAGDYKTTKKLILMR